MKYVVTGGGGFVGGAICRALRQQGCEVISIARGSYPQLEAIGVRCLRADVGDRLDAHYALLEGAAGIYHTAAKVAMWGKYAEFARVNIGGTANIIAACRACGIERLVYTSSPSVIADGTNLRGIDESYPYPGRHHACYPATKMVAERMARDADGGSLRTVVLRPHLIWGPGDTNLVPTILEKARRGKLVQVGSGENLVDLSYIDDCAAAHLAAMRALESNPACRGKAYFISQGEPVKLWWWINQVLQRNGLPTVQRRIPARAAALAAGTMEVWARISGGEPLFTRFLISEMSTDHYFDISAARRDLGYRPEWSIARALEAAFAAQPAAA